MAEILISVAEKYLKKGAKLYVEGRMETRKWTDKEGTERYATEVVVRPYRGDLVMLDRKEQPEEALASDRPEQQEATA